MHRIDAFDSGVCVAVRDLVEVAAGKPRKASPRPEDAGVFFMRKGDNRKACGTYAWNEFAHVSNISARDFAALRISLLNILSDTGKTEALLRQSMRNVSENTARALATRLEATRLTMGIELMSYGPLLWSSGMGATVMLRLESIRVMASVAYEPGNPDTVRVDTMFAGEGVP